MKYAFLLTVHTDYNQLERLVTVLKRIGDIIIHVDKKTDIDYYRKVCDLSKVENPILGRIYLTNERINCAWGGYSQCEVQCLLLSKCFEIGEYERVFFLSGLDYPLLGKKKFEEFFDVQKNKEFVCGWNLTKGGNKRQLKRVELYHFFRNIPLPPKNLFRLGVIVGTRVLLKLIGIRKAPYIRLKNGRKNDVFFGGQWSSLTYECAKYVLHEMQTNKRLVKYFKTSYAPDELLIPTIVFNSKFAQNAMPISNENYNFKNLTPLHYLNYTDCIWSYDENDFDTIMNSRKVFVRKVVSGKSEKLIEMINKTF